MRPLITLGGLGAGGSTLAGLIGGMDSLWGGLMATVCQVVAVALLQPKMKAPTPEFMRRWFGGIGIRLAGLATALILLSPLQGGLGYVGVLLPLLFTETLFLK